MRRRPDGFRPVVEFLIASACQAFEEEGVGVALTKAYLPEVSAKDLMAVGASAR